MLRVVCSFLTFTREPARPLGQYFAAQSFTGEPMRKRILGINANAKVGSQDWNSVDSCGVCNFVLQSCRDGRKEDSAK